MSDYIVTWRVFMPAANPREAAKMAQRLQKLPKHMSNLFMVVNQANGERIDVDLDDD